MKKEMILNIGAGKSLPLNMTKPENKDTSYFLVNLDPCYNKDIVISIPELYYKYVSFIQGEGKYNEVYFSNLGWKDFATQFVGQFDRVIIYRFLEHVPMVEVPYFIYILSTFLPDDQEEKVVEGIVPDYQKLCKMVLNENPLLFKSFEKHNILVTTEILNEPYDPHASIWTRDRLKYFFELEGRFDLVQTIPDFKYDHRNIYIWFEAKLKK